MPNSVPLVWMIFETPFAQDAPAVPVPYGTMTLLAVTEA